MEGISFIPQHQTPPWVGLAGLTDELLHLQERMNMALEWLLTTRATMDSCCKELELNAELVMHLNKGQAIEAIKEAEVCHATTACVLQQTCMEYVLNLECKAKAEGGKTTKPLWRPLGWPYKSVCPKPGGH